MPKDYNGSLEKEKEAAAKEKQERRRRLSDQIEETLKKDNNRDTLRKLGFPLPR